MNTCDTLPAADIVRLLDLAPHPEGGHFRETFREPAPDGERGASTAIYFLLGAGEVSRWHRVDALRSGIFTPARHFGSSCRPTATRRRS
jgi:uncharacterized protein